MTTGTGPIRKFGSIPQFTGIICYFKLLVKAINCLELKWDISDMHTYTVTALRKWKHMFRRGNQTHDLLITRLTCSKATKNLWVKETEHTFFVLVWFGKIQPFICQWFDFLIFSICQDVQKEYDGHTPTHQTKTSWTVCSDLFRLVSC